MRTLCLAVGAAGMLAVAGCGSDDDAATATDGTAARGYAETGEALNDICRRAKAETEPLVEQLNGSARHDAPLIEELLGINQDYVAEVRKVRPAEELREAYDGYVAQLDVLSEQQEALLEVAQQGDDAAYQSSAEALGDTDRESDRFARALGATDCAQD